MPRHRLHGTASLVILPPRAALPWHGDSTWIHDLLLCNLRWKKKKCYIFSENLVADRSVLGFASRHADCQEELTPQVSREEKGQVDELHAFTIFRATKKSRSNYQSSLIRILTFCFAKESCQFEVLNELYLQNFFTDGL